ncbi:MAG: hypothetical protein IIA45_14720 [Bacteroidetes bacterium]|nr:hypothetical protein [Bacteroidota bacterium]
MKKLSMLLLVIIGLALITSCSLSKKTEFILNDEIVSLKVTSKTTLQELEEISIELLTKKNIKIDFSKSEFKSNGLIKVLELEVDCQDGFGGSVGAPYLALKLGYSYGFERTYKPNGEGSFKTGTINLCR